MRRREEEEESEEVEEEQEDTEEVEEEEEEADWMMELAKTHRGKSDFCGMYSPAANLLANSTAV